MPPYFESLKNSQKLTIVSFVLSFGWNHFMWIISHRMLLNQIIQNQLI